MRTLLFCTSHVRNEQSWISRYRRWIDYYAGGPIQYSRMLLLDDASPFTPDRSEIETVSSEDIAGRGDGASHLLVRFPKHLGRQSMSAYPGWWRSFFFSLDVARAMNLQKIVHVESDAFVLSTRLADFLNDVRSGWHTLWLPKYGMPETAVQVICEDQLCRFAQFQRDSTNQINQTIAEHILPFTHVHKEFTGDRYSEFKRNRWIFRSRKFDFLPIFQKDFFWKPIPPHADFATQVVPRQSVVFRSAP
ncbi:putative uncharacterized protein [Burkholderiales bacterium GJ-E10]|nr:putative uncharacterized protein [Burkholderiales bacterium GJ-E10]